MEGHFGRTGTLGLLPLRVPESRGITGSTTRRRRSRRAGQVPTRHRRGDSRRRSCRCSGRRRGALALAAEIPPERLPPLLFVASVHRVACGIAPSPSPPISRLPGGNQPPLDHHFAGRYRAFCLEHRDELLQSPEPALLPDERGGPLHPGGAGPGRRSARSQPERELALLDMGTGSGLGLYLDRYRFTMSDGRGWGRRTHPSTSTASSRDLSARGCRRRRRPSDIARHRPQPARSGRPGGAGLAHGLRPTRDRGTATPRRSHRRGAHAAMHPSFAAQPMST